MPPANVIKPEERLLRTLVYGLPKTRKTAWSLRCASAGFNVIYLEGDDQGGLAINQIPAKDHHRVQIIPLAMTNDRTVFAPFMAQFLRPNATFTWDEQAKQSKAFGHDPTHGHYRIAPKLLTPNDVLVIDGWKALSESSMFQFAQENEIDLSDAEKVDWDGYNYQGNFLNWVLARLHSLECHVIVIGHATIYEKWDRRDKKNPTLIEQRIQLVSSSGPHAKKLASEFTDVLYFTRISSETVKIDTGGDKDRDGGSRLFPPAKYDWNDFGPEKFFEKLAWKPTGEPCKAVQWFAPGEEVPMGLLGTSVQRATTATPQAAPVIANEGGLAARLQGMKK
jgi:hypothetical protein